MLLADPVPEEVHGLTQGGRNNDDGDEPEERVPGEEPRDGPRRDREAQEEPADDEIVLVKAGGFRAPRVGHPSLEEGGTPGPEGGAEGGGRGRRKRPSR